MERDREFTYKPIGVIRSPHTEAARTPIQPSFAAGVFGSVEVFTEYEEGLRGLEVLSHICIVYPFDRSGSPSLLVTPCLGDTERGVFATRAPRRPNAIGLSVVRLVRREGTVLHVEGLDVLDGTPLFDIKPCVHGLDACETAPQGRLDGIGGGERHGR